MSTLRMKSPSVCQRCQQPIIVGACAAPLYIGTHLCIPCSRLSDKPAKVSTHKDYFADADQRYYNRMRVKPMWS